MDLVLPDLGEGITEGEVARLLVKPGDKIIDDQVVLEVLTDKATVEIPCRHGGTVTEILVKEGDVVKVGSALLRLDGGAGAGVAKSAPAAKAPAPAAKESPAPMASSSSLASRPNNGSSERSAPQTMQANTAPMAQPMIAGANVQAAPAVRKMARERGIDLTRVSGSGPNGRVLLGDLETTTSSSGASARGAYSYAIDTKGSRPQAPSPGSPGSPIPSLVGKREERVPLRGLRKKIVEKMAQSKRTAAHFTCVEECDVTELVEFRNSIKDQAKERGVHLTFMPFIAKACVFGLRKYPQLNSSLVEDGHGGGEIVYKNYFNIGVAVDTVDGLTVPVVHDVDKKSMIELAADINDAGARARDRKLHQADFTDGTFTISNAGKVGGLFATPIINYPEVAILGVHEIRKRPMVVDNEIKIRDVMYLSISIDHRVVDGATGILFLNELISYLSNPKKFLMEMM